MALFNFAPLNLIAIVTIRQYKCGGKKSNITVLKEKTHNSPHFDHLLSFFVTFRFNPEKINSCREQTSGECV